jgi:hypothetical protein
LFHFALYDTKLHEAPIYDTETGSADLDHSTDDESIGPFGISTAVQSVAYLAHAMRAA